MSKEYKIKKLKNGMRVLLVNNKSIDSVNVSVFFRVGSRCEAEDLGGISHFLEHMFFKGTKKRPEAKLISEEIDSVGGEVNAFTSYEYTGYYIKVAKQHLQTAVDVLSDMMIGSKFETKEINRERNVIVEEKKMYEDTPQAYIWRLWNTVLYNNHGLGRDIVGSYKSIDNIDRKNMLEYRDKYYSVNNGLIVVVGNFSESKLMEMLNKYWKNISKGDHSEYSKVEISQTAPELLMHKKDTSQGNFCVGVRTYKSFHKDHYVCNLIATILGQGMSSRLFLNVREKRGLAYSVSASVDTYTDVGNIVVKTGTDVGKAKDAVKIILQEFKKMKTTKVPAKELKKAKEYWKGKMILSLEHPETLASMSGMQELMYNKIVSPEKMMKEIDKVTIEDILRVSKDIFVSDRLNMAIIGPYKNEKKFEKILKI